MAARKYEIHPAAELFPMMDAKAFEELKADIRENGVKTYITLFDDKIIDGRNRYKACLELGIDPAANVEELEECDDPISFVLSLNLHRRHLNETQRATVAAKIAKLKLGDNQHAKEGVAIDTPSADKAAQLLNVSRESVQRAKHAIDKGSPEVVAAMERGEIAASAAAKLVDVVKDKAKQAEIVKQGKEAVREAVRESKKPVDASPKSECVKGGSHEWTEDDGDTFCEKCKEPGEPVARPAKAKKEPDVISRFKSLIWDAATKNERATLKAWIADQ